MGPGSRSVDATTAVPPTHPIGWWTGEFDDFLLERRYWSDSVLDHARWCGSAVLTSSVMFVAFAAVDLAALGLSPRFLVLVLFRLACALLGLGCWRLLQRSPEVVRNHLVVTLGEALVFVSYAAVSLSRPDLGLVDNLVIGTVLVAMYVLVPNRLLNAAILLAVCSAIWVVLEISARHLDSAESLAVALSFLAANVMGFSSARQIAVARRQEFGLRISAEHANERLVAEIRRRQRLEAELVLRANLDPLTKVANRRHFEEQADGEFRRAQRSKEAVSILVLDVDHFKVINDTHGHATGDEVLRELCDVLSEHIRRVDIVGRLGGEEFAVVMPGAEMRRALEAAERLRARVSEIRLGVGVELVTPTVSIGVAEADVWTETLADALARADDAMYLAKQAGRNRVVIAETTARS